MITEPDRTFATPWTRFLLSLLAGSLVAAGLFALLHIQGLAGDASPGAACPTGTSKLPPSFTITVDLQRPNADPPDPSWAVPVRFTLHPPGDADTICHEWQLDLDQSGRYVGQLSAFIGLYDARIKNIHTLRNLRRDVEISATNRIDMGTLREGDANDDNYVKGDDFSMLHPAYRTQEGDPDFDPRADFDEDGWIKGADFSLLHPNYRLAGDIVVASAQSASIHPAADEVTLTLVPLTQTVSLFDVFTTAVQVHAGDQPVDTLDFDLQFPAEGLTVVDAQGQPATTVTPGEALSLELWNEVDNEQGLVSYSAGAPLGAQPPTGTFTVAAIRFKARAPLHQAPLHFTGLTDAYNEGSSVLGRALDGSVTVVGGQIFLPLVVRH